MKESDVVMAELWLNGKLLIEERWEDIQDEETGEIKQETRYAIPGGKVEEDETDLEAVVREIEEETGIIIQPDREFVKSAEELTDKPEKVKVFRKLLDPQLTPKDGIILCAPHEVIELGAMGKLMPYTKQHVDKEFVVVKNGA
jgi:8-oxo-dGTP pyrophosphatase MutT (NUDIX family)